jgi:phage terminase large subunit
MANKLTQVTAEFNKVFKEANRTQCRYKLLMGGAGSGKSVNVAMDYVIKLSDPKYTGSNLLVIRETETSHLNSTFAELTKAISVLKLTNKWIITKSPMLLTSTVTGSQIIFKGFNYEDAREKIKSISFPAGKLTWIWIEEATDIRFTDFQFLDDRLRGVLGNNLYYQLTLTFNPVHAQHWIKRTYWDLDSQDIFKLKTTYLDNRFMDEAYHRRMELRKEIDPDGYQVFALGNWGEMSGQIFTNYKVIDVNKDPTYYNKIVHSQDFGFNHANAILTVGFRDNNVYVMNEIYVTEMDTNEIIELANQENLSKRHTMWCDSAEPDRIKMWKKAGYQALGVKKEPNSVAAQIDYLKQFTIYIDASCKNTIREIQQYRWQKDKKTGAYIDTPIELDDDTMACLRYSVEEFRRDKKKAQFIPIRM